MSSSTLIGLFSTGLWQDLGSPVNVSALSISGYCCEPSTLGRMNSMIGTCYSGSGYAGPGTVNYDVVPDLSTQELALIDAMYRVSYYNGLITATMGYGGDSIPFTSVAEGDTRISRTNAASIGSVYQKLAQQAVNDLKYLTNVYINQVQAGNQPRSVILADQRSPSWSTAFWGNG